MSKFFATLYVTKAANERERWMYYWAEQHVENSLIASEKAFDALVDKVIAEARRLEEKFPKCRRPLRVMDDRYPGGPWFISVNESLQIRCTIVTRELTDEGEEVKYEQD